MSGISGLVGSSGELNLFAYDMYHAGILTHGLTIVLGMLPTLAALMMIYYAVVSFAAVAVSDRNFFRWFFNAAIVFLMTSTLLGGFTLLGNSGSGAKIGNVIMYKNPGTLSAGTESVSTYQTQPFETMAMMSMDGDDEYAVADNGNMCQAVQADSSAQMNVYRVTATSGGSDNSIGPTLSALQGRVDKSPMISKIYMYLINSVTSVMFTTANAANAMYLNTEQAAQQKSIDASQSFWPTFKESDSFATRVAGTLDAALDSVDNSFQGKTGEAVLAANGSFDLGNSFRGESLQDASIGTALQETVSIFVNGPKALPSIGGSIIANDLNNNTVSDPMEAFNQTYQNSSNDPNGREASRTAAMDSIIRSSCVRNTKFPSNVKSASAFNPYFFFPSTPQSGTLNTSSDSLFIGDFSLDTMISNLLGSLSTDSIYQYKDAVAALANLAGDEWNFGTSSMSLLSPLQSMGGTGLTLASTKQALQDALPQAQQDYPDQVPCIQKAMDLVDLEQQYKQEVTQMYSATDPIFESKTSMIANLPNFIAFKNYNGKTNDTNEAYALVVDNHSAGIDLAPDDVMALSAGSFNAGSADTMAGSSLGNMAGADLSKAIRHLIEPLASSLKTIDTKSDVVSGDNVERVSTTDQTQTEKSTGSDDEDMLDKIIGFIKKVLGLIVAIPLVTMVTMLYTVAYYTIVTSAGLGVCLIPIWVAITGARALLNPNTSDDSYGGVAVFPVVKFVFAIVLIGVELMVLGGISSSALYFLKHSANIGFDVLASFSGGMLASITGSTTLAGDSIKILIEALVPLGIMIGLATIPVLLASTLRGDMYQPSIRPDASPIQSMKNAGNIGSVVSSAAGRAISR